MSNPARTSNDDVALVMKVVLAGSDPAIWRRVSVPLQFDLAQLHDVIQVAMGWRNSHLHVFTIDDVNYVHADEEMEDEEVDERDVRLMDVARVGQRFIYHYDFGDDWIHEVEVELSVNDPSLSLRATCLDGRRACPPEDCGGVAGYEQYLEILQNPASPEYREVISRLSATFDADAFNLDGVNKRLRLLR